MLVLWTITIHTNGWWQRSPDLALSVEKKKGENRKCSALRTSCRLFRLQCSPGEGVGGSVMVRCTSARPAFLPIGFLPPHQCPGCERHRGKEQKRHRHVEFFLRSENAQSLTALRPLGSLEHRQTVFRLWRGSGFCECVCSWICVSGVRYIENNKCESANVPFFCVRLCTFMSVAWLQTQNLCWQGITLLGPLLNPAICHVLYRQHTLINPNLYSVLISDRKLLPLNQNRIQPTGHSARRGLCARGPHFLRFMVPLSTILALGLYEGLFYVKAIRSGVSEVIL